MTFVLDALHLSLLEGNATVNETFLVIQINNTTGRNITFSKVCASHGKIVTFIEVMIQHGFTLTINADATHFGWSHGDTIHWSIDYMADDPVFYISKQ